MVGVVGGHGRKIGGRRQRRQNIQKVKIDGGCILPRYEKTRARDCIRISQERENENDNRNRVLNNRPSAVMPPIYRHR